VTSLVELSLAAEHRRGHAALHDGVIAGRIDLDRLHNLVACQQIPRDADGRIVLAIDVSNWLRPGADTSPARALCHTYPRGGGKQMIPGWPYSFVAALEPGRSSWTASPYAHRLTPDDDTAVTAARLRIVVTGLVAAGVAARRPADLDRRRQRLPQHPPGRVVGGSAGAVAGADARQPGAAVPGAAPHTGTSRSSASARGGVPVRRRDDLARAGAPQHHRHPTPR
jgi:hypothetical protein